MKIPFLKSGARKQPPLESLRFRAVPLVAVIQGEILGKYTVDQAAVFIVDREGRGLYLISEPELTPEEQRVYSLLMEHLYFSMKPVYKIEDPMKYVESFIWEAAEDLGIVEAVQTSFQKYRYYISRDAFGYGPLHVPMMDPDVEEISVTSYAAPVNVIHGRFTHYDWLETNIVFGNEDLLRNYVQRLAQRAGKSVTVAIPFTDAMTREGHRVAVTFADEVTLPGSTIAIRKFPENPLSMAHLLKNKTLTPLMAAYLWLIAEYKGFIITIGAMGTGKTTMLNCVLTMLDPVSKIATIEDVPELRIPHQSWQRFKARHTYSITETKFDVDLMDLVKLSVRYRPDYITVGEVRGEEIRALVQAAALGHGCLCRFHAEGPEAAIIRMKSPPMDVPEGNLMLIWCFVLLGRVRLADGSLVRRVLEVTEVVPRDGRIELKRLFTWDARNDTFYPDDAEKVVQMSYRLGSIRRLTGWSESETIKELEERAAYLVKTIEDGKLDYPLFAERMRQFYVLKRRHNNEI
ncbi:MAG: type II/IV secretion system ATPase subunit [Nitrososphaerota archaeon]